MCVTNNPKEERKMANNINPLKFGITDNRYYKQEKKEETNKNLNGEKQAENQSKKVDSNEVLGFMAAQNADIVPAPVKKTVDVSKYVSDEQEARIAEFMKGFESDFDDAFDIAKDEFPEISDEAARNLALSYINSTY